MDCLNCMRRSIKYTMEAEKNGSLLFFDVLIRKKSGFLHSTVYRMATHTDRCLRFDSNHPLHVKRYIIQSLYNRDNLLCQNEQDRNTEMKVVRKDLLSNPYQINLLGSIMYKKPINETELKNSNGRPLHMFSIAYNRGVAEKFRRISERYSTRTIFKTKCTLSSYLRKTKPKLQVTKIAVCV
jgi:hypothetical protein